MRRFFLSLFLSMSLLTITGCGNLSPRQNQNLENQNGKIGEVENLANSVKTDVGKLQSQADIQNSKLDKIQQGLANIQTNYDNRGVMIFSGSGGIVAGITSIVIVSMLCLHYRNSAKMHEKTATILAERVVHANDPVLLDEVFAATMHTNVEENVLRLIKKFQN